MRKIHKCRKRRDCWPQYFSYIDVIVLHILTNVQSHQAKDTSENLPHKNTSCIVQYLCSEWDLKQHTIENTYKVKLLIKKCVCRTIKLYIFKKIPFTNQGMLKLVCPCRFLDLGQCWCPCRILCYLSLTCVFLRRYILLSFLYFINSGSLSFVFFLRTLLHWVIYKCVL